LSSGLAMDRGGGGGSAVPFYQRDKKEQKGPKEVQQTRWKRHKNGGK